MGPTSAHPRSRPALLAAFFAQGFVFISLTTRLPRFADRWDLDEMRLSGVLLLMILLAGLGSVLAEHLASRRGSARALQLGLLGIAVAVPGVAGAANVHGFVVALAVYGLALGMVDAGTNMQGVAVEHLAGRPLLPSFHGAWTVGGVSGAGLALATSDVPLAAVGCLAVVPLGVVLTGRFLQDAGGAETVREPTSVAWRPVLLVGLVLVLFYTVETAAMTWGPLHLANTFDAPRGLVALATFPYLGASGTVRLFGDRLVERHGPVRLMRAATLVTFFGLAAVVLAPTWAVAVAGFVVVGAGTAVIAPLSFSAAGQLARTVGDGLARRAEVDAVIARFNQFNYAGALLGAVLTGLVGAGNLRVGFAVPLVLVLLILPLARAFAPTGSAVPR